MSTASRQGARDPSERGLTHPAAPAAGCVSCLNLYQPSLLIIQNRKMYVGSSVSSTPVIDEFATATFWPFHDGISGTSSATMSCSWPICSLRAASSVSPISWSRSLLTSSLE